MKVKNSRLALGFAALVAASAPAAAGGDYYGGVPVPAPIPVPVYDPVWYFRIDTSLGLVDSVSASESGMEFGHFDATTNYGGSKVVGTNDDWLSQDFEQFFTWGVGIGYRWCDWFRMDVTGETLREQKVRVSGHRSVPLEQGGVAVPGGELGATTEDKLLARGGLVMFNAYYDFAHWGGFHPYVGAGLGIGIIETQRDNTSREVADDGAGTRTNIYNSHSQDTSHEASIAASATVGTTYQLTDITELDLSYRYLYVEGVSSNVDVHGHGSTISIDDVHDHQLRAGLRFNVN